MKVNVVQKARQAQGTCEVCHKPIEAGQGYRFIKPRYGAAKKRHLTCANFRESDKCSGKMAGVYAAVEGVEDFLADWDGSDKQALQDALDTAADDIEAVGQEYQESADNIVDGFGHETAMSEELVEKADGLTDWAEEIRRALDGENDEPEDVEREEDEDDDEYEQRVQQAQDDWADSLRSAAEDVLASSPF